MASDRMSGDRVPSAEEAEALTDSDLGEMYADPSWDDVRPLVDEVRRLRLLLHVRDGKRALSAMSEAGIDAMAAHYARQAEDA